MLFRLVIAEEGCHVGNSLNGCLSR